MEMDLAFPTEESILGEWHLSKTYGQIFIIRCHLCDTLLMGGYEQSMINNLGMDATEEWVEHQTKFKWNEGSPCPHIKFELDVGVTLQDTWIEWAGREATTGSSQKRL